MAEGHPSFVATYRRVAHKVHPDLAANKIETEVRTVLMTRANKARDARDLTALEQVEREWERLNIAYTSIYNQCLTVVCISTDQERWLIAFREKADRAYAEADRDGLDRLASMDLEAELDGLINSTREPKLLRRIRRSSQDLNTASHEASLSEGDFIRHARLGVGYVQNKVNNLRGATLVVRFTQPAIGYRIFSNSDPEVTKIEEPVNRFAG